MIPTLAILLLLGAVGHVVLWTTLVNRVHGFGAPRRWIHLATNLCGLALAVVPLVVVGILWRFYAHEAEAGFAWRTAAVAAWCYVACCVLVLGFCTSQRWRHARHPERGGAVLANHTTHVDVRDQVAETLTAPGLPIWVGRLPGNQVLGVQFHEEQLRIPRLPAAYDGVRIAHLSDLHMSGRIRKGFFIEVADRINAWEADLVGVTGDLVENDACIDWVADTLGRLRAPGGVYYVLGNHDRQVDQRRLHEALTQTGMIHVGDSWRPAQVRGAPLVVAGNELPWYARVADLGDCSPRDAAGAPPRILLAHGPDQFRWAQDHDFDLMLAGHNHGGQVRLPLLGPILAPSRSGVRYASGVFQAGPTVMHVSRGVSSHTPIRWNCPPEVSLLVLRSEQ